MYFRLMGKLNARRKGLLEEGEKGFTLIELLVVVIIIGILAAIAIPIYIGVQNNAKDAATKSDLANAKTAYVAYWADNASAAAAPTLDTAGLGNYGFSKSDSTSAFAYGKNPAPSAGAFCIQAVSAGSGLFHVTDSAGPTKDACP